MTGVVEDDRRRSRRYAWQIWALCVPEIIAAVVGVPLLRSETWRLHGNTVPPALGEVAAISVLVTTVCGLFFNGGAIVFFVLLLKVRAAPPARKVAAAIALVLSLIGFVGTCVLTSNIWGD